MFSLVSNGLSSYSPATAANAAQSVFATAEASASARALLPTAVPATSAPVAYFPGTPPQRQAQDAQGTTRVQVPPPTGDYIVIDTQPVQPQIVQQRSTPVTLGIPLTAQLNAQFFTQQEEAEATPSTKAETPLPGSRRETSFASARGAKAYAYAAQRSAEIHAKPEVEAV